MHHEHTSISAADQIRSRFGVVVAIGELPDAPGYWLSADCRMFSVRNTDGRSFRHPCELKMRINGRGYLSVCLRIDRKVHNLVVHRMLARLFLGEPPDGCDVVRHLDGNPLNNDLSNLAWGTQVDNMSDARRHGTIGLGERNSQARLTGGEVDKIRRLLGSGLSHSRIAKIFGIARQTVTNISTGARWVGDSLGE